VITLLGASVATCTAAALSFGLASAVLVVVVAAISQSLGKLALDAVIQREAPEQVRTSVFARSETALQLAWVIGGTAGVLLIVRGTIGFAFAAAAVGAALIAAVRRPSAH